MVVRMIIESLLAILLKKNYKTIKKIKHFVKIELKNVRCEFIFAYLW